MQNYKILEHPADIGIIAYGKNIEELFIHSAFGMMDLMVDIRNNKSETEKKITINSSDLSSLLIKWLDEILFLFDAEKLILYNINKIDIDTNNISLCGNLSFYRFNIESEIIKLYIKAVTYHQIEINNKNNLYEAKVIFDV